MRIHDFWWNIQAEFTPGFSGVRVNRSLVLCVCFVDPFVLFLLAIVLSVLLRFTDSYYPLGFFKLFLNMKKHSKIKYITSPQTIVDSNCWKICESSYGIKHAIKDFKNSYFKWRTSCGRTYGTKTKCLSTGDIICLIYLSASRTFFLSP